jgi:hypothetical protein
MSLENEARPKVVSQEEWVAARKTLLAKEKDLTHARDALVAQRRRLPMVRIEKPVNAAKCCDLERRRLPSVPTSEADGMAGRP